MRAAGECHPRRGPHLGRLQRVLYWVEIKRPAHPSAGIQRKATDGHWSLNRPVGFASQPGAWSSRIPKASACSHLATGDFNVSGHPEENLPGNRFNDGKEDRAVLRVGRHHGRRLPAAHRKLVARGCRLFHPSHGHRGFTCSNGPGLESRQSHHVLHRTPWLEPSGHTSSTWRQAHSANARSSPSYPAEAACPTD